MLVQAVGVAVDLVLLDVSLAGSYANPVASELDRRGIRYMAVTGLRQRDLDALGFKYPVIEKPFSSKNLAERLVAFDSARKAVQSGTSFSSAGRMAE